VFTIYIEAGEETCIPHLHILGTPMSSWLVVRENILLECLLVTFVVTLGRRWCCRVVL
jgi:hypothetical protein